MRLGASWEQPAPRGSVSGRWRPAVDNFSTVPVLALSFESRANDAHSDPKI